MQPTLFIIPVLAVTVFFLVRCELNGNRRQIYFLKPVSTLLVISIALLSGLDPSASPIYATGIITGLIFSLGGDVALMFPDNPKTFRVGLVLFLLAHIAYAAMFTMVGAFSRFTVFAGVIALVLGLGIFQVIRSGLGSMKASVIAYMVIISVMLIQAVSTCAGPQKNAWNISLVVGGALLFYISDIILALNRFWRPFRYNRFSLFFYYGGQMMIALSTGFFLRG